MAVGISLLSETFASFSGSVCHWQWRSTTKRLVGCHCYLVALHRPRASASGRRTLAAISGLPAACGGCMPHKGGGWSPQLAVAYHHCQEADLVPTAAASYRRPLVAAGQPALTCCGVLSPQVRHASTASSYGLPPLPRSRPAAQGSDLPVAAAGRLPTASTVS